MDALGVAVRALEGFRKKVARLEGKLEAVTAAIGDSREGLSHEEDFRPHYDDPDFECLRCRLDRILKGGE